MSDRPFHFRQFTVHQSHSAMKVGTDAVLLGVWARIERAGRVLDVGTGTGVIALLAAQRNPLAQVHAIEIDQGSADDAAHNFAHSPWPQRLHLIRHDFLTYDFNLQFDLIISNPPYFSHSLRASDPSRSTARHDDTLPSSVFLVKAEAILAPGGRIAVIFPKPLLERWSEEAHQVGLYPQRVCHVFTLPTKDSTRVMVEFGHDPSTEPLMESLTVEKKAGEYSEVYKEMMKDYFTKW